MLSKLRFFLQPKKIIAQYKIFNTDEWLSVSIASIQDSVYKILIIESDVSWGEESITKMDTTKVISEINEKYPNKIIHIKGSWNNQQKHVQAGLTFIKKNIPEATHCLYIDTDEIYDAFELKKLVALTTKWKTFNREIRIRWHSYFKTPFYRIDPPEPFYPMVLFPIRDFTSYTGIRSVNLGFINVDIWLHHLSYVRKDDNDIRVKMITHKSDEGTDVSWYHNVYLNWTPESKNFHPKNPEIFKGVKVLTEDEVLPIIMNEYGLWEK